MKRALQAVLLYAYRSSKSIGLMDWELSRRAVEWMYFFYKRHIESPHRNWLRPYVRPGTCVIDVGANIGFFSCLIAEWVSPPGRVIAIEPAPENLDRLEKQVARRGLGGCVEIVPAIAADGPGTRHLVLNPDHPGDHRLGEHGLEVQAETLDSLIEARHDVPVSLVKLDVQGAEQIVLAGAAQLLSKAHPALLVEIDDAALATFGSSASDLVRYLADRGYAPHTIEADGVVRLDEAAVAARARDGDYLDVLFLWDMQGPTGSDSPRC